MVRATGAKNPIVIGGLDWSYDLTGVMAGNVISDPKGDGIIYSTHIYTWKGTTTAQWDEKAGLLGKTLPLRVSLETKEGRASMETRPFSDVA